MRHFTHISDLGVPELKNILDRAADWKRVAPGEHLRGKLFGMVFFNPSLRTRASFEAAMLRGGGHAVVLDVGAGVWKLEDREGAVMDADRTEHIKEAAPVLARYVDMLGVRSFSNGVSDEEDEKDSIVNGFRNYADVPVISMESAREHPCQGLADLLTVRQAFGDPKGLAVTLTWAPHVKPLPKAVPNSFLLTAAAAGCNVRIAHPKGFELHAPVMEQAKALAEESGGNISVHHDQREALQGSHVLYAKSWGPNTMAHPDQAAWSNMIKKPDWMPTLKHFEEMVEDAVFLHCLPVRRNVEVADEVLDSPRSLVVDEAENRFHVQRVLLDMLARGGKD